MSRRIFAAAVALIGIGILVSLQAGLAQATPQLQLMMIGGGDGPYYAPAGNITQLKLEILNLGASDVYLIRGEAYLDPSLNGNWQLSHSEEMGSFHLGYLQSAVWTFDLKMPTTINAANSTAGVPQVVVRIQVVYSVRGQQTVAAKKFLLSVPGAVVSQPNNYIWLLLALSVVLVVVIAAVMYRRRTKGSARSRSKNSSARRRRPKLSR